MIGGGSVKYRMPTRLSIFLENISCCYSRIFKFDITMGNKKLYSSTKTLHEKKEELKFKGILLPGICAFGKKGKKVSVMFSPECSRFDCTAVPRNKNTHRFSQRSSGSRRSVEMFTARLQQTGIIITLQGAIMSPRLTSGLFFLPLSPA